MISLRELQLDFSQHILADTPARLASVITAGSFSAQQRLQVYANNVHSSLKTALRDVYPAVHSLVGDGFFAYIAHQFIPLHPSRSANLHQFGAEFAQFLASHEACHNHRYLPDVAALEWAWHCAFHGAESAFLRPEALAEMAPEHYESLLFAGHPTAQFLTSQYPIIDIWQANRAPESNDQVIDLGSGGDCVLVCRPRMEVHVERLSGGTYRLLTSLTEDVPFGEACELALAAEPQLNLSACLMQHILDGTLVGLRYNNQKT